MEQIEQVRVGIIGKPHGVSGEVLIELRTDEPERRFATGAKLLVAEPAATLTVSTHRWLADRLAVRFAELADRTAVEAARGWVLLAAVPFDETPDQPDEFYDRQLIGLAVRDHTGVEVGSVRSIIHHTAQDTLEIETAHGLRLVPFVTALVPDVRLEDGYLQLADTGGLLYDSAEDGADSSPTHTEDAQ